MGNRDGPLALAQARSAISELASEWPDIHLVQKTVPASGNVGEFEALFNALEKGAINIALVSLERLPDTLPEGITLASVTKRLEPRSALIAKGKRSLEQLSDRAAIGVGSERDAAFLHASGLNLAAQVMSGSIDSALNMLASGDLEAVLVPCSTLIALDRRDQMDALLDPEVFVPAVGVGSVGLLVKEEDDNAFEVAYTLQHRPSFDRVRAERSFQKALREEGLSVGALASVTADGELSLLGAVALDGGPVVQATTSGEASEAQELGTMLAQDVLQQLKAIKAG